MNFNPIKMPNFDGTGPAGKGPHTGRGRGKCAADKASNQPTRRGFGRGAGRASQK